MQSNYLNIVCFDVPYPADYGGAIEEFYKLKSLAELGVKIHLHCFIYRENKPQYELEKYCEQVNYYKRNTSLFNVFSRLPYIVKSRMNQDLLENLLKNDYPILFDGTHSTGFANHPSLKNKKKIIRFHNIEWIYYNTLFRSAIKPVEQLFFYTEYKKLRKYDTLLQNANHFSCLSETDIEYYSAKYDASRTSLEFVFHEHESVKCLTGRGTYILYHGNLSVLDNYMLLVDLLNGDLKECAYPIVIAGKNPAPILKELVEKRNNIQLVENPSDEELLSLIQNAQICLALAQNPSGIKLKLINSLFLGRFVFSNEQAFAGSGLEKVIIDVSSGISNDLLDTYMQQEFSESIITQRKQLLMEKYNNRKNAIQLIKHIFGKNQSNSNV